MDPQQIGILVGRQIGLPVDYDGTPDAYGALDPQTKLDFTAAYAAWIRAHPDQVSEASLAVANKISASPLQIQDTDFSMLDFFDAAATNADDLVVQPFVKIGGAVGSLANGIAESAQATATAVKAGANYFPILLLAVGVLFLLPYVAPGIKTAKSI